MSETAKEDIVDINTEPQIIETSTEDMEIEIVDDRPIEDRVPPRDEAVQAESGKALAEDADVDEDSEASGYSDRVQKRIKKLSREPSITSNLDADQS